jgi:hypothetical protein
MGASQTIIAFTALMMSVSCTADNGTQLCPDLTITGNGNRLVEEGRRCVRVMAARYSASGESPNDVATAALEFCRDRKIAPIVSDIQDLLQRERMMEKIEAIFRNSAIHTVVEMRTGSCLTKPGLFDGINEPITKP